MLFFILLSCMLIAHDEKHHTEVTRRLLCGYLKSQIGTFSSRRCSGNREICQTFFSSFLKIFEIFFRKCQKHRKKHNEKAFKPLNYTFSEEKSQTYRLKTYDKTLHRRGGRFLFSCSSYAAFFRKRILNSLSFSSLNPFCL